MGMRLASIVDTFLDGDPVLERDIFQAIGDSKADAKALSQRLEPLRHLLAEDLSAFGTPNVGSVKTDTCTTDIRGHLLTAWACAAKDPAARLCQWLFTGAPAGLERGFDDLDGLFPRVAPDEGDDIDTLASDYESFSNYTGVDDDPDAAAVLEKYIQLDFLKRFRTLQEVKAFVGGNPILNKLGLVVRYKTNTAGQEVKKTRIIVDNKESGVTRVAKRTHRSTLPRPANAVQSAMGLMDGNVKEEDLESYIDLLVADVSDAFWQIPLHPAERKYFVVMFKEAFLVFLRTAQGSRGAPLTWAALAALVSRCMQSLFCTDKGRKHKTRRIDEFKI